MKLLITGAYGLVGSAICKLLEKDFPDIEITKIKCDEIYSYGEICFEDDYDYIIHAAGYGQPQKFSENKVRTININTDLTRDLIKYVLKPQGKFLFVSSSEIYSGAPSPHKETDIGTTTPQHPRACYIEGKRCGEAICMAYKEQGYDVKIARLALAYGPGTKKGDTRVLNQFIEQALTTGKIQMKDRGRKWRTYLYVEDAAQMLLNVLFKGKYDVYNIGGESSLSIGDLARSVAHLMGDIEVIEGERGLEDAPGDVDLMVERYKSEFPIEFTKIGEGLKKTIEYQKTLYGTT